MTERRSLTVSTAIVATPVGTVQQGEVDCSSAPGTGQVGRPRHAAPQDLSGRHHGIDAVRGAMMALGVVLHLAINYVEGQPDATWPFRDSARSPLAGIVVMAIHTFRMPAFFVMSGYFAAMLVERGGIGGFVRNRLQRIALPAAVAWAVLFPVTILSFIYVRLQAEPLEDGVRAMLLAGAVRQLWDSPSPIHLWFLEVLLAFCALSIPALLVARVAPRSVAGVAMRARRALMMGRWRWMMVPVLVALTFLTMLPMRQPGIDTPGSFAIPIPVLACYGVYFTMGWWIRREPGMLERLVAMGWWHLVLGIVALLPAVVTGIAWFVVTEGGQSRALPLLAFAQVTSATASWLLVLGMMGVAERILVHPRPIVRWIVDASFWIYLVHLPLCVLVPWAVSELPMGAVGKFMLSFVIVSGSLVLSYEAVVMVIAPRRAPRISIYQTQD